METVQTKIEVNNKILDCERENFFLKIDAIYKTNKDLSKTLAGDVLSKLFPVGVQGGFRYKGSSGNPLFIVIYTSGEDLYWRDQFDNSLGVLLYYGDNKQPGKDLHDTKLKGNKILRDIFAKACSDDFEERKTIPPIFVFKKAIGREVKFLGLAVPGIKGKPQKDWLISVWGCNKEGDRFQNYKSYFTIIDTSAGSQFSKNNSGINLAWINDILEKNSYNSKYAPYEWKKYIDGKNYTALTCKLEKTIKAKQEQLPDKIEDILMLDEIQKHFIDKDNGYSFEYFANDIIKYMDENIIDISTTSPYKDGGFDGIGKYKLFGKSDNEILVDFYVQAKCYNRNNSVGVSDTSRLISRIKDRQFGIMFTTSYVANQAYKEIIEDGHPIVIVNGRLIIEFLKNELEILTIDKLKQWLKKNY